MSTVSNAMELGQAIEREDNTIVIEGDLRKKVVRIKATGKVAWLVAGGAIAVAIVAILAMPAATATGPFGLVAEGVALGAGGAGAVGVLGIPATVAAISIGVGAKSKKAINKLRDDYDMKDSGNKLILTRKRIKNTLSQKELEYADEVKACLEDDGVITDKERRLLNRLAKSLELSPERAIQIEEIIVRGNLR